MAVPPAGWTPPPLPDLFAESTPPPRLHYQGAEALLYRTHFLSMPGDDVATSPTTTLTIPSIAAALKHRPPKAYRHPQLDAKLTRHRILAEARVLARLRRDGVAVPALLALDASEGWLMMEWVEGEPVRAALDRRLQGWLAARETRRVAVTTPRDTSSADTPQTDEREDALWALMGRVGRQVGRMHGAGIVHGDLTTSNILLRSAGDTNDASEDAALLGDVVLIDFGLSEASVATEDRAVDLYVLERAFGSTHPRTEDLFREVLRAYGDSYKGARATLKKLEDVRMRGRKKIMIG